MLKWVVIFLIISLIAGLFGFGGISQSAAGIARILFYVFLIMLLISAVLMLFGR